MDVSRQECPDQQQWSSRHTLLRVTQPNAACSSASSWAKERKLSVWSRHCLTPRSHQLSDHTENNKEEVSCIRGIPNRSHSCREQLMGILPSAHTEFRGRNKKLQETNKNRRPKEKDHISKTVTQWRFSLTSDKITSISRMRSWLSHVKVDLGLKGSARNDTACVSTQMSLAGLRRSPLVWALRTQALIRLTAGINGPVKLQTAFTCNGGSCCAGWSLAALFWAPLPPQGITKPAVILLLNLFSASFSIITMQWLNHNWCDSRHSVQTTISANLCNSYC